MESANFLANKNVELDKICRVCLSVKKEMQPLFAEQVAEMLMDCTAIKVEDLDGWPDKICIQCVHQVSRSHAFKQRVEKTDNTLRQYIKGLTVVIEDPLVLPKGMTITQYEVPRQKPHQQQQQQHQIQHHQQMQSQTQTIQTQNHPQIILTNAPHQQLSSQTIAQLINAGQLQIATTNPTSHLIQNGHLLQGAQILQGQQIQMITNPNGQTQIVQLQTRNGDERCEILMQPEMQDTQYYEEVIISNNQQDHGQMQQHQLQIETIDDSEEEEVEEMQDPGIIIMQKPMQHQQLQHQTQQQIIIQQQQPQQQQQVQVQVQQQQQQQPKIIQMKDEPLQASDMEGSDADEKQYLAEFMTHQTTTIGTGQHVCNLCHKEFKHVKWLQSHMKNHSNWIKAHCRSLPECEVCHKTFRGPGMLKMHMKTHEREDKLPTCSVCNKEFKSKSILYRHRQSHFEKKTHACTVCNKDFATNYQLNAHMSRHQGIKNHKCSHCDKAFYIPSDLKSHIQLHLGIKTPKKSSGKSLNKD